MPAEFDVLQHPRGHRRMLAHDRDFRLRQGAAPHQQVLLLVRRQVGLLRAGPAGGFLRAAIRFGGDLLNAPRVLLAHGFAGAVALAQERQIAFQFADALAQAFVDEPNLFASRARRQRQPGFQGLALEAEPNRLEAFLQHADAVIHRFQLGRFIHDVHGSDDLADVMEPASQPDGFDFLFGEADAGEFAVFLLADVVGKQYVERRHPLNMIAGVGRFAVDGDGENPDQRIEESGDLLDQARIGNGDGGLRSQRLGQRHGRVAEGGGPAAALVDRIDQLQRADCVAVASLHRRRQHRARAIAGQAVVAPGAGKIVFARGIDILDADRPTFQNGARRYVRFLQRHGLQFDFAAGVAGSKQAQRRILHDSKAKPPVLEQIKRARVGVGQLARVVQRFLQQRIEVQLRRQRDADFGQAADLALDVCFGQRTGALHPRRLRFMESRASGATIRPNWLMREA
ncbi:MAG: hypothetical protein BWZ10_01889 [candidate division BRC1 bacterium ADurb.BinA364]|nr:MAG: hypothetical protein BWZ10_01889 [candidate division BRC1 bacterium ADurb.BinA364]